MGAFFAARRKKPGFAGLRPRRHPLQVWRRVWAAPPGLPTPPIPCASLGDTIFRFYQPFGLAIIGRIYVPLYSGTELPLARKPPPARSFAFAEFCFFLAGTFLLLKL
jgi:hypothetical protein